MGCVRDSGLSGACVGQFCGMCSGSWTFRCMSGAVLWDVFGILDFHVHEWGSSVGCVRDAGLPGA